MNTLDEHQKRIDWNELTRIYEEKKHFLMGTEETSARVLADRIMRELAEKKESIWSPGVC